MSDDLFDGALGDVSAELERIGDLADGVARRVSSAFRGALVDGRSFRSVLADIAAGFADIALKAAFKPIGDLVGGLVESVFTATNPALGGVAPVISGLAGFGGAPMDRGTGGGRALIAAPAYFPSFGESTGALPGMAPRAAATGTTPVSAGTGPVNVTFNVTASDARSFAASEAEVSAMLLRAVRRGTRAS